MKPGCSPTSVIHSFGTLISTSCAIYVVTMFPNNFFIRLESHLLVRKLVMLLTLTTGAVISSSNLAQAANINLSYGPGTSLEQMIGLEMAGSIWSKSLADSVTVNIHVETTDLLPKNVIGGTLPGIQANQSYETWRSKLRNDRTSTDDNVAFRNLQSDEEFTALVNGKTIDENEQLNMTRANAKALGMRDSNNNTLDGFILISNLSNESIRWNYDFLNNTVPSNTVDFLSVGIHELGHNLGFVSGVDDPGFLINVSDDGDDDGDDGDDGDDEGLNVTSLDMFRYSTKSAAVGAIDLSIGGNPFFSINGGKTALGSFSTGEDTSLGGDGYQASHWKQQDSPLGIMDPLLRPGQRRDISTLDQQIMDVIGWDLQSGTTDLATLQNQAKARLAQRLGKTVEWLDANPIKAALLLSQDRTLDVQTMIKDSKVYNWRGGSTTGWWQDGLWQEMPSSIIDSQAEGVPVPEPSSAAGWFLGSGFLGMGFLLKRCRQKQANKS